MSFQLVDHPTTTNFSNMKSTATATTASGYLTLLQEGDIQLREIALKKLLEVVDILWHEIAEALPDLEAIAEDTGNKMAAAIASRVFFHLNESHQALRLALLAGEEYFQISTTATNTPYVEKLIEAALDEYIRSRKLEIGEDEGIISPPNEASTSITNKTKKGDITSTDDTLLSTEALRPFVYRLLQNSCSQNRYDHAVGIVLEAREIEKLEEVLNLSGPSIPILKYTLQVINQCVSSKQFRLQAYQIVANCWQSIFTSRDNAENQLVAAYELIIVYQLLNQAENVATILLSLLTSKESGNNGDVDTNDDKVLTGYQLCFDLMDSDNPAFILNVTNSLLAQAETGGSIELDAVQQAIKVLKNGFVSELKLSFLYKNNHADRSIIELIKKSLEERSSGSSRNSVLHHSTIITHCYLYAGTTNDTFLRDHLDYMKKASNWAKFSATASLGVVHASHVTEAMQLLQPYLPPKPADELIPGIATQNQNVSPAGGYSEGGSLYALGLIHGSHSGSSAEQREEATSFLRSHLRASHANEVISHGACLGVGLTAMGTADLAIINELKEVLDTDSAVAGEAAGIAIGMVLVGTGACNSHNTLGPTNKEEIMDIVAELKNYARETQHEKIIRGIAIGLALMNYGQEENADALIEEMRSDRDPIMRYGAQYAIALAYCGTGSNKAIRILLHTAVSDVSNDVRMAAVIGLAFVLYKTPERVPQLVKLLLESFNPHVRYSTCMAVGIAMAGTGDSESIAMLEPMLEDMTDYVRQGALMGTAMIYMQQSDTCNRRKIRTFRDKLMTIITEKHQSTLTKMGAIISIGIMDAGGRNCSIALGSLNGLFTKMSSAVGLVLWLQHWHWYPMMHMLSLALSPTISIGLNKDFKYPKKDFNITCHSKPSLFAYPKKLEEKKEEKKKRVETVTLSITIKEKARLARKKAKLGGATNATSMDTIKEENGGGASSMDIETNDDEAKKDAMEIDVKEETSPEEGVGETAVASAPKKKKEPEPSFFIIGNPTRITKLQSKYCTFDMNQRYQPIRSTDKPQGVIILKDTKKAVTSTGTLEKVDDDDDDDHLGSLRAPSLEPEGELPPPEAFEWIPPPPSQLIDRKNKVDDDEEEEEEEADDKISTAESSDY